VFFLEGIQWPPIWGKEWASFNIRQLKSSVPFSIFGGDFLGGAQHGTCSRVIRKPVLLGFAPILKEDLVRCAFCD